MKRIDHMKYLEGMEEIDSDILDRVISSMNDFDADNFTRADVKEALSKENISPRDFQALLSPAAEEFLEDMAIRAQKETRKHFGNSIYMFTPLYIS